MLCVKQQFCCKSYAGTKTYARNIVSVFEKDDDKLHAISMENSTCKPAADVITTKVKHKRVCVCVVCMCNFVVFLPSGE